MLKRARREPVVKEGWGEAGTFLPGSESGLSLFSLCCVQEAWVILVWQTSCLAPSRSRISNINPEYYDFVRTVPCLCNFFVLFFHML